MLVTGSYDFYYLNNYDEYCDILKLMYIRHYLVTFPDNSVVWNILNICTKLSLCESIR